MMVRDFQAVISKEARQQILDKEGKLPAASWPVSEAAAMHGYVLQLHRR